MEQNRGQNRGRGGRGGRGGQGGRGGGPGRGRGAPRMESPAMSTATTASASSGQFQAGGGQGRGGRGYRGDAPGGRGGGPPRGGRGGPVQIFADQRPAALESRFSAKEQDELVARFQRLSPSTPTRVIRPGFGKQGDPIVLRANFFALKYPKNVVLYDYDIKFTPSVKNEERRLRKRILELLESSPEFAPYLHEIAHDRSQRLISRRLLPDDLSVPVNYYEEGRERSKQVYTVTFGDPKSLASKELDNHLQGNNANYDPLPIISAFNLITSTEGAKKGVPFGKNRYFFPPSSFSPAESPLPLSSGLEAWKGFFTSVRPVYKQLMVNVNVCMSAFYTPYSRLSDAMLEFQRQSRGAIVPRTFYRKVKVASTYLGYRKKHTIKDFGVTPRKAIFECEEYGGKISVEQYFKKKYKITLKHADDLPVMICGDKRQVFVPPELCEIESGQAFLGTLSEKETAEMITYACNPPYVNAQSITGQGLKMLGLTTQASPMEGFGVEISPDMAVVPGRVLRPPSVMYQSGQARVADGSWNILGVRFHRAAPLTDFAVLVIADGDRSDFQSKDDPALEAVVRGFMTKCQKSGMDVSNRLPPLLYTRLPRPNERDHFRSNAISGIEQVIKTLPSKPKIILVFMSNRDPHIYPGLKKLCDVKLGVATVCMLMPKVRKERGQDQYYSNIALKVNTKLGGINHKLDQNSMQWLKNGMLVGMDVTHPGLGCPKGTPSIAAVVASCDGEFLQFPASLRLNGHREEMIQSIKEMMIERLTEYRTRMRALPERVFVFRDGVSEGQFDIVLKNELPEIKAAFQAFQSYNPKLSVTICGKRHHTRFYPTRPEHADKTSNTKAGTVVDQGVTAVYDFNFYLQAHAGLQGTVRSTHYTVIYDENKLQADTIQKGTNDISYLWARATKSVSLVPPAYWADIACERARLYLHEILPPPRGSREESMSEEQIKNRAKDLWGNGVHDNLKGTMFYL